MLHCLHQVKQSSAISGRSVILDYKCFKSLTLESYFFAYQLHYKTFKSQCFSDGQQVTLKETLVCSFALLDLEFRHTIATSFLRALFFVSVYICTCTVKTPMTLSVFCNSSSHNLAIIRVGCWCIRILRVPCSDPAVTCGLHFGVTHEGCRCVVDN